MWFRRLRWWRTALLTALAVVGLVLAASWVILRVYGPAFTRERVEALLSKALGQPARVGAVHLRPWRARLSLVDLDVPARATPPDDVLLRAASIDMSIDIASLWRRELTISALATDVHLEMTVPRTGGGGAGIFPLPRYVEVGPFRVGIGSIGIRGGHAVIREPEAAVTIEVAGADLTARPALGDLDVSGRLDMLGVDALGRRERIDRVTVDGRLSADLVRIRQIGWRWQGEAMLVDGEVRRPWLASRELSLRAKGHISIAACAKAAALDARMDGRAEITAEIIGPATAPRVAGRVRIPELGLAAVTAHEVAIDGQWVDDKLRLDDIQARLGTGRLRGRLEAASISTGRASLSLDLGEVVLPGSMAGLGPGTVVAEGRARDGGIDLVRAQATWRGLAASLDGRIATGPPLAMRGKLTADLQQVGRAIGLGPLSGQAVLTVDLTGRGQAPALDGRVEIANLVADGHAVEPVAASFHLAASPGPDARWEGAVQLPHVRWDTVAVDNVAASLSVDGRQIELTGARARAAGVPVEAAGLWRWAGSGRGHATLGPVSLGAIAGVPPWLRLGGSGRATVEAAVEGGVASASAVANLEQVSASGVSLGAGQAGVRVRGHALEGELHFPARRLRARTTARLSTGGTLTSSLELDDLALQPLLRELRSGAADHVEGRVSSRAELSIPLGHPASGHGVVRLMPDGLRLLGEPWASQGPIVLRWEGTRLVMERFRLDSPAGSLSATGSLGGTENRGLSLALDHARLPGALVELGRGAVRAELRLDGGDLELTRLDAQWPGLVAAASGHARGDGTIAFSGRVDAELARLGTALGVSGIGGRATLTADARGRGDAIEASGAVRAPQMSVRGASVSDVELPLRLSRSSLRLEQGRARIGMSRISADASATWRGPLTADSLASEAQVKVEIRAPAARLEDLAQLLPSALRGRGELALAARAEGTLRAWRGTGSLASPLLELGPGPIRQLRAAFALDGARVDVTALEVDAFGVPARATATWAWAGGGSAKATLGPAPLSGLAMVPAGVGLRGSGRATIEAAMRSPSDVTGTARAAFDDVTVGAVPLGRGQFDVSARDGVLSAELAFPEQRLRASGSARIDAGGFLVAEAAVLDVDLAPFTRALGPAPGVLGGTVSARATARVPLAEPRRGEGLLSIDPVRLAVGGDAWESRAPIQVRWAQGALSLAEFRLAAKNDGIISGAATLGADGKLDARASAQVPLAMLAALRPEIREIGGVLDLALRASGSPTAPRLAGDGAIHRGTLLLRDRPETLRDIEARFSLSGQGVQIMEATGSLGGGHIQARGDIALSGGQLGGYRFKLQAQNVAVGQIEGFSSAWDADLELSGITREAQLGGRARLVRGVYNRDLSILSLALSPTRAAAADTGTGVRLQVRVDLDDNLVVRSRIADLRAGGVLSVEGTTARPVVFGSVEARDGRLAFRGRDWRVTNATVRFADPRRLDPVLDVLATSRIGEYDVTMQITGLVSSVAVRFSSTPRLSQNDLLSLVAFGATGAVLRESPATVLLGEAGKLLAQNVLNVEPSVTGLRVSTGSSADSASELHGFPGEERSVGRPQNTPAGRKDKVRVEYQLLSPLFLSGEYDRDGGYGADVVLRFRFR
jgi:autotransporter translocation and assembly factor TamB